MVQHFTGVKVDSLSLDVMLYIDTLLAVLIVHRELTLRLIVVLIRLVWDVFTGKFRWSHMSTDRRLFIMLMIGPLPLLLLFVFVPGTGCRVKDFANLWATGSDIVVKGCALVATFISLTLGILATKRQRDRGRAGAISGRRSFGVPDTLAVGLAQCVVTVFLGFFRSDSILLAGLVRDISRQTALDYSFVIGVPAIVAVVALELKDALREPVTVGIVLILAGVIITAIVGFLAIKLLCWMAASDKPMIFVWYILILGVVTIATGALEHQTGWITTFPS